MTTWNDATKYLRIAALSFWVYDWLLTLPAEIRLSEDKKQFSARRISVACLLLFLVRYLGLAALITNFVGFFGQFWHDAGCRRYYRVMPIMQTFASWASHAVFVVRTVAICDHDIMGTVSISVLAVLTCTLEMFAQLHSFHKYEAGSSGNCLIEYSDKSNISWLYYLSSTVFDVAIIGMTYHGLSIDHRSSSSRAGFTDVLWKSSLVYFCATAILNILNLAFYAHFNNSNATVLGAFGIAVTSMMSSRVILNLHEYSHQPASSFQLSGLRTRTTSSSRRSQSFALSSAVITSPRLPQKASTGVFFASGPTEQANLSGQSVPLDFYRAAPWTMFVHSACTYAVHFRTI
ncbi:hypothetical protein FISHEDRAFT_56478 [Fistulina hepatica ATCC 64428]|uniref:DUF6533 domain-containing protein n=1 Tax=Fistulina hepatica ATCC 64428 TaxID=1128425 RepID=A0A0D7AM13_9AGAR|nr:hypothetical protein FISHEDRAFT_56478 [Fistulina hepatica ATCC 64428]